MPPSAKDKALTELDTMTDTEFDGMEFETVYEGLGETWDWSKSPVLVGKFIQSEEVNQLKYGSKTEYELRKVYTLRSSSGVLVSVWGSVNLDRGFAAIEVGQYLRLTYQGKNEYGDGKKMIKDFIIEAAKPKS